MAYTTPPTFNSGDVLAASDLNILGDDIVYLKGITDGITASGVQVGRSTNQSIGDSTFVAVTYTGEGFDFGGWWSSGTDIIVPAGAIPSAFTTILVMCIVRVSFASNGTGYRRVRMLANGAEFARQTFGAISGDPTEIVMVDFAEVAAADVITTEVYQTSGGSLNLATASVTVMRYAPAS